jgi:hypothetical protein
VDISSTFPFSPPSLGVFNSLLVGNCSSEFGDKEFNFNLAFSIEFDLFFEIS